MSDRQINADQVQQRVLAIAQGLDLAFDSIRQVMQSIQILLVDANLGTARKDAGSSQQERAAVCNVQTEPSTQSESFTGQGVFARPFRRPTANRVHVTRLLAGVLDSRPFVPSEAQAFLADHSFDLVIDETTDTLALPSSGTTTQEQLHAIPSHLTTFLWLVLTHSGKLLRYEKIAEKLGYDRVPAACRDNRIHRLRNRFNAMFGELAMRVFGVAKNRAYRIHNTGWAFCWLREADGIEQSHLLRGLSDKQGSSKAT